MHRLRQMGRGDLVMTIWHAIAGTVYFVGALFSHRWLVARAWRNYWQTIEKYGNKYTIGEPDTIGEFFMTALWPAFVPFLLVRPSPESCRTERQMRSEFESRLAELEKDAGIKS